MKLKCISFFIGVIVGALCIKIFTAPDSLGPTPEIPKTISIHHDL